MSNALAFVAGLGSGYMNAKNKARDQERQDRIEAEEREDRLLQRSQQTELHDTRMREYRREDDLRKGLADAAKPGVLMQNAPVLTNAGGQQVVYGSPETAEFAGHDAIMARRAAEAPNAPDAVAPVGLGGAVTLNGNVQPDLQTAQKGLASYDDAKSILARQQAAYNTAGMPDKAMGLKTAQLNLDDSEMDNQRKVLDFVSAKANRAFEERVRANGGDVFKTVADVYTETNVGGLAGVKVLPVQSEDGKTISLSAISPDGSQRVIKTYPSGQAGMAMAMQDQLSVPPEIKAQWLHESAKIEEDKKRRTEDVDHRNRQLDATVRHQAAMEKNASDRTASSIEIANLRFTQARQLAELRGGDKSAGLFEKMSGRDQAEMKSISERIRNAESATLKPDFDPESTNGKRIAADLNGLLIQQRHLLDKYDSLNGNAAANDPNGLRQSTRSADKATTGLASQIPTAAPVAPRKISTWEDLKTHAPARP